MKRLLVAFVLALALPAPGLAVAHDYSHGSLGIIHPWARFTAPGAPNGAVYLVIENTGAETDRLVGAATPRAEKVEFHATGMDGEVMTMHTREAIEIKPKEIVAFEPGGLHIMLFKLKSPLVEGEKFPLTLRFEKAGEVMVDVLVERGEDMTKDDHHRMKMDDRHQTDDRHDMD